MPQQPHAQTGPNPQPPTDADLGARSLLRTVRLLRSAGGALLVQAALHGQLAQVEWEEEKRRLAKMLLITLLGLAFLVCVMLLVCVLVLALSWETAYRIPAMVALIAICALACALAWRRVCALSALSSQSFAATREEIAADIALLKSKL